MSVNKIKILLSETDKYVEVPVEMKKREHGSPSQNIFKSTWYLIRALLVILLGYLAPGDSNARLG
jgi:hypothetical protein